MVYERFSINGRDPGISMDGRPLSQSVIVMELNRIDEVQAQNDLLRLHLSNLISFAHRLYYLAPEDNQLVAEAQRVMDEDVHTSAEHEVNEKAAQILMTLSREIKSTGDNIYHRWVRKKARQLRQRNKRD